MYVPIKRIYNIIKNHIKRNALFIFYTFFFFINKRLSQFYIKFLHKLLYVIEYIHVAVKFSHGNILYRMDHITL